MGMGTCRPSGMGSLSGVEALFRCDGVLEGFKYVSNTNQLGVKAHSIEEVKDVAVSCNAFGRIEQSRYSKEVQESREGVFGQKVFWEAYLYCWQESTQRLLNTGFLCIENYERLSERSRALESRIVQSRKR